MHAAVLYLNQAAVNCLPLTTLRFEAPFHPETSVLIQKRHPYTGNLKSET